MACLGLFNGMMSHTAWFEPLAGELCQSGYQVVGVERRGSGLNTDGRGDAQSAAAAVEDAVCVLEHAPRRGPLVLVGWCWGAALSVAVAHALRPHVHALVLVTPGLFSTQALRDRAHRHAAASVGAEPDQAVIPTPIDEAWFTRGPALEDFIRRDALRVQQISARMLTVTQKLATAALVRLRARAVPVLVVLADEDEATDNAATRDFFEPLGASIESVPGRHGVQFDAPTQTVAHIDRFIRASVVAEQGPSNDAY